MTLTQNGTSVSGTQLPLTIDLGSGMTAVFTGVISGNVAGANVNLAFQNTVVVRGFGDTLNCRGTDSFAGQISGNTLNGTFSPGSTPYICDGGIPLPTPRVSGPMIFTRQ